MNVFVLPAGAAIAVSDDFGDCTGADLRRKFAKEPTEEFSWILLMVDVLVVAHRNFAEEVAECGSRIIREVLVKGNEQSRRFGE